MSELQALVAPTTPHGVLVRGHAGLVIDSGLVGSTDSGRGTARAEDAQGTPTQSHISPSILLYEDNQQSLSLQGHRRIADRKSSREGAIPRI